MFFAIEIHVDELPILVITKGLHIQSPSTGNGFHKQAKLEWDNDDKVSARNHIHKLMKLAVLPVIN